ncbi:MAG TPA: YceI family protein [Polyangiaceae bacterium]|jgi:polyisoprenoid-binding protein YceI
MANQKWNFDPAHSTVGFSARHMMITKVTGRFKSWSGTLEFDPSNLASTKLSAEIDAASVDTQDEKRDGHLKSADFFDVEKFPKLTFAGTKVESSGKGKAKVTGDLTIHGTTRAVTLDVEYSEPTKDPWGGERVGIEARTTINRKDFNLNWNVALEAGGILVSEKIQIELDVQATKA